MTTERKGMLAGLRVLEFGQIAAGPFMGCLFADLGADVVKVERPDGGDGMRNWPPLSPNDKGEVYSENFASLNRNKRSITVNLKDLAEVRRLKELCATVDVIVENFRPGVLSRSGLGYDDLKGINPGLVYCSLSGYGQTGPYSSKGAFDVTVQAISGVMSVTGENEADPVKCGVPFGDICVGLYGAFSALAAIIDSRRTGRGANIDCSMLGCMLGAAALQTSEYFGTGKAPGRWGSAHPRNAPYQAFRGSDKHFVIAAGNDRLWGEVCEAVERPDLAMDPRFITQELRARNQADLFHILQNLFEERTADAWLVEMDRRGVPCAPINDYADILNDPHVDQMGIVKDLKLPNGVTTRTVDFPVSISGQSIGVYAGPPKLGAHTEEIFMEWLGDEKAREQAQS